MAESTVDTYLLIKNSETWKKLVDIKDYPDLGGEPETLETTTLSDHATTSIMGLQSQDALSFTCNYTVADFKAIKDIEGETNTFAVAFGKNSTTYGTNGVTQFTGQASVYKNGGDTNAVREMTVSIIPNSVLNDSETSITIA